MMISSVAMSAASKIFPTWAVNAASSMLLAAETTAGGSWNGVTTDSLMTMVDSMKEMIPIVLPVAVAIIVLRKTVNFFLGLLRGI